MVHQRSDHLAPDSDFEPGSLRFLVPGNEGRAMDPRRTPIRVVDVRAATGEFELEILDFEDAGARWTIELRGVVGYQFARGSAERASTGDLDDAITRFDRPLEIPAEGDGPDLGDLRGQAGTFLPERPTFDLTSEVGDDAAQAALAAFMQARGLSDIEDAFASRFVLNPYSGELVKGHRIVVAELGLASYRGKVVRDPALFDEPWSKARRADHIRSRLAFVRELFSRAGHGDVLLWRGLSTARALQPHRSRTFISASFDRAVAESLFQGGADTRVAVLYRQRVPIERLFMTYVETAAMNLQYLEREAVLFFEPGNLAF